MNCMEESAAGSRWLSTKDAAAYLGVAVSTLNNDRVTRLLGLPFSRMGRRILYDRLELDAPVPVSLVPPGL